MKKHWFTINASGRVKHLGFIETLETCVPDLFYFTADQVDDLVYDLQEEVRLATKYTASVTYETYTTEDLEAGEPGDRGYEVENEEMDEDDMLRTIRKYGISEDCGNGRDFRSSDPDRSYVTGEETFYTLHLAAVDGEPPDEDDLHTVRRLINK